MKPFKSILVLAAIAILLYLTNPPLEMHEGVVNLTAPLSPEQKAEARDKFGPFVADVGSRQINYQDYLLFSTTTDDDGGRLSIGILRMVFSLRSSKNDPSK